MVTTVKELKSLLVESLDEKISIIVNKQVKDPASPCYGGIWEEECGWANQKSGMNSLEPLIAGYLEETGIHFHSPAVREAIDLAFEFCDRLQRPDGTFDLFDCNFFSGPDTAFGIQSLWRAHCLLEKADDPDTVLIRERLYGLIDSSARGVAAGGFHTPNHRWVIASALLLAWKLTGTKAFHTRAMEFLAEGIDCNEDGEFSEKSAAIYNVVNDYALILIFEMTGDSSMLEHVNRNLELMRTFYEPDGSVFTANSTRQDNGEKMYPPRYFYLYFYMAQKTGSPSFLSQAGAILNTLLEKRQDLSDLTTFFLTHPEWDDLPLDRGAYLRSYSRLYEQSGIARMRDGDFTVSVMRDNPTPVAVQLGELTLYMRIGISFFNIRNLMAQSLTPTEKGYCLKFTTQGKYYLPEAKKPENEVWGLIDPSSRKTLTATELTVIIHVDMRGDGADIRIETQGCDKVPLKFEFGIPEGCLVDGDHFHCRAQAGMLLTAKDGHTRISNGREALTLGPAFADNTFIRSRSGIVEPSRCHMNLYFTGMTNFSRTVSIRTKEFTGQAK